MVSKHVTKLEYELQDKLEEYFPKGCTKYRGKALVLIAMAKELGVQGHADYIKSKKFVKLGEKEQ